MQKSDALNELATALAKAQKSYKPVKKTSENPFFKSKYADLAEVIDASRDALSGNGLSVVQLPATFENGAIKLTSVLLHSSGQFIAEDFSMPVAKADAQGVGSAITYARRYALSAIIGVASEADDDANNATVGSVKQTKRASENKPSINTEPTKPYAAPGRVDGESRQQSNGSLISDQQAKMLWAVGKNRGMTEDGIKSLLGRHGFEHTKEVTRTAFDAILKEIQQ